MCQHITFDRNRWAPCAICLTVKRNVSTVKNQVVLREEAATLRAEAAEYAARGRSATAASRRQDAEEIENRLLAAGCAVA